MSISLGVRLSFRDAFIWGAQAKYPRSTGNAMKSTSCPLQIISWYLGLWLEMCCIDDL